MKNKTIWYVSTILFFLTGSVYAQDPISVSDIIAKMGKELNLTQQQVDAVKPIIREDIAKREELRQSIQDQTMIADRDIIRGKIEQLDKDVNQKLSQILTHDQMNKWVQKQKLRNAFNRDQMDNTRWNPGDERHDLGMNF